jgi:hypothetical protein
MNRLHTREALSGPKTLSVPVLFFVALCLSSCGDAKGPLLTLWEGDLAPIPPSQISGDVAAVTQFGRTEVEISIRLAEPGTIYTWRIESGTCQSEGVIQDGPAMYPQLEASEGGNASENTILASLFRRGSVLAAKVFRPDGGAGEELVSCGMLVEK